MIMDVVSKKRQTNFGRDDFHIVPDQMVPAQEKEKSGAMWKSSLPSLQLRFVVKGEFHEAVNTMKVEFCSDVEAMVFHGPRAES